MAPITQTRSKLPEEVTSFEDKFHLTNAKLKEITEYFMKEMTEGLESYGKDTAMVPSYVTGVPDGTEEGTFLALDLGGTNLRVCEISLLGQNKFTIKQQKYKVSTELKEGEAVTLFDYIADSVDAFLTDIGTSSTSALHLGFTFSFPVEQTALDKGKILTWTKGFAAKNAIGHDVVKLLQDSFDKKHIHVKCSALVNDTVGTLLSRSYQAGPAVIGAIFGTGTNGAYLSPLTSIKKLGDDYIQSALKTPSATGHMIINTEWGALDNGRHVLPVTLFDNKLDRESINPRKQAFEKMISGMYLGEITRNMLLHFVDSSIIFQGYSTKQLNTHYGLDTALMSAIEAASSEEDVKKVLQTDLGFSEELITSSDIAVVHWCVQAVGKRAAQLSACAISAVLLMTADETPTDSVGHIDIGVDGSVAELYPHFRDNVQRSLEVLLGKEKADMVRIGLAKDGSGVGAALAALQAKKDEEALAKASS